MDDSILYSSNVVGTVVATANISNSWVKSGVTSDMISSSNP